MKYCIFIKKLCLIKGSAVYQHKILFSSAKWNVHCFESILEENIKCDAGIDYVHQLKYRRLLHTDHLKKY
jgi:hypothetical protein